MTICVPKEPFDILVKNIIIFLELLPIPTFIGGVYLVFINHDIIGVPTAFVASFCFVFTYYRIIELNNKYHWLEWCKQ